jgi:molybdopterin-containing oxidoreductase family iron-sulfur binding subunit
MKRRTFLRVIGASALAGCARSGDFAESDPHSLPTSSRPRLSLVVDLGKCRSGCRDCIDACHTAHNVPVIPDPAHEVKWVWTEPFARTFPSAEPVEGSRLRELPVPVLCNHCDNPPCVRVCPAGATWKRPDGIVTIDMHRCIGCRYCMAACPYGSRSFNWVDPRPHVASPDPRYPTRTKGVVEKCNFCEERVARGGTPACVEACAAGGLAFGDANDRLSAAGRSLRSGRHALRRHPELGTRPSVYYLLPKDTVQG